MRTLDTPGALDEITTRIAALRPTSVRRWGMMQPGQMLRHLYFALEGVATPAPFLSRKTPLANRVGRFFILRSGIPWPRNYATLPELKALHEQPVDAGQFAADQARLLAATTAFPTLPAATLLAEHPYFGPFTREEWMRWAYLHADHHLRQFSC